MVHKGSLTNRTPLPLHTSIPIFPTVSFKTNPKYHSVCPRSVGEMMDKKMIGEMITAVQPNYEEVPLVFYYSLGFYKDADEPEFYKGGLTDNIPKRLYDLRSYVQKRGYAVDFERDPHVFFSWEEAKEFEDVMLDKGEIRATSPFGYFNGHTELFTEDPLGVAYEEGVLVENWDSFWKSFDKGHHHPAWGLGGWLFE